MDLVLVFGTLGAFFSILHLLPELILALRTRQLDDVSWLMLIISLFNFASWITYGALLSAFPIVFASSVNFTVTSTLIVLKIQYKKKMAIKRMTPKPRRV